jgi:hypothetical protein
MRKTILSLAVAGLMLIASTGRAWAFSEADSDTWLGKDAAHSLAAGDYHDTFIGADAGYYNTTGYYNSFLGADAGYYNTTGYYNSFLGAYAGYYNTTGVNNSFIGADAGYSNTDGAHNSFMGYEAGYSNTNGYNNSFIGVDAGYSNTGGGAGSFIGSHAGYSNTTGANNSFMGYVAGFSNTTGYYNSFIGSHAGYYNTTGANNSFIGARAGIFNTDGHWNSFMGYEAGYSNTTGPYNSFIGARAGYLNTTGHENTFIGFQAGILNTTGFDNSFMGYIAGYSNTTGDHNSVIGAAAGYSNSTGSGNLFLGSGAGYSETGSNKLYIDNCYTGDPCTDPFIYGEFDNRILKLDGALGIGIRPIYGVDVSGAGLSESQLHFSLNGTDTGGWVTSVADNNFWLSSGAVWDQAGGGWVQKSPDKLAVMAGSGPAGYRVLTRSGCEVNTACQPTSRMIIDYSGNVGFGITPTFPLHMASGARVTAGGVWTDASSRDYKEDIRELSTAAAMSTLQGLNPVTFKYKATQDERHVGFIAEDVPELVASSDRKGMSPMDVVAVLTRVVQEQQEAMQEQRQANQELMKKVTVLEAQQEVVKKQQEINQELMQKLTALEAEMKQLRESGTDGRLAWLAN